MKSNSYEEIVNPVDPQKLPNLKVTHANLLENKIGLPPWTSLECPYCKEEMQSTSIRSIAIKLNPRNIGDVCVEFLCDKCSVGNTLYFVKAADNMLDFIDFLNGSRKPPMEPITEEEMYKAKYHNTIESMILDIPVQTKKTEKIEDKEQNNTQETRNDSA